MKAVTINVTRGDISLSQRGCTGDAIVRAASRVIPDLRAVTYSAMFAGARSTRIALPPVATELALAIDRREAVSPVRFTVRVPDELMRAGRAAA
jgi:hypothetical protein